MRAAFDAVLLSTRKIRLIVAGVAVMVLVRDALADAVWVRPGDRKSIPLGTSAAAKILVESA